MFTFVLEKIEVAAKDAGSAEERLAYETAAEYVHSAAVSAAVGAHREAWADLCWAREVLTWHTIEGVREAVEGAA